MSGPSQGATAGRHEWPDGTGMIYLSLSPWDSMWKNRHQLMSRFCREMPVLYVEPWRGLRRVRRNLLTGSTATESERRHPGSAGFEQLTVLGSRSLPPVSTSRLLGGVTQKNWLRVIRSSARAAGIHRPILWISHPRYASAIGRLDEQLSIYHIVDEYGGYTRQQAHTRRALWRAEQAVLQQVDTAIAVSPQLVAAKSGHGATVHLVENAVDYAAFAAWRETAIVPGAIADVPAPRLGYCGLIGKRLDLALLDALAAARADWSVVLVGRVDERDCAGALARLRRRDNVFFLGEQPVDSVPALVSSFQAGLLPYERNLETENISPLKMYEYLAAGLPVVSTAIPAAERQRDHVTVCRTTPAFVDACAVALDEDDDASIDGRRAFARQNSWDARVEQIRQIILRHLESGAPASAVAGVQ